jgi:hypothetical protein
MAFAKAWNEYNAAAESVIQKHGSRSISEIDDALRARMIESPSNVALQPVKLAHWLPNSPITHTRINVLNA